jgi:hypothetical protein
MWLVADDSLGRIQEDMVEELLGLECLLTSIARGEHAIAIKPSTAASLAKLPISRAARAVLQTAGQKAPEYRSRAQRAEYRCHVELDGPLNQQRSETEWKLQINFIARFGMPKSAVLAENLTDAEIFKYSAEHYRSLSTENFDFHIALLGGGGADTPKTLLHELTQRNWFVFCITDSDRISPDSAINHTSRECFKITTNNSWVSSHRSLEEREAENHIPFTLVKDSVDKAGFQDQMRRYMEIEELNLAPVHWRYLDLKEGTRLRKCFGARKFWGPAIEQAIKNKAISEKCGASDSCKEDASACKCLISPGIAEKILETILDHLRSNSIPATAKRAGTAANSASWSATGKALCDWGASVARQRV